MKPDAVIPRRFYLKKLLRLLETDNTIAVLGLRRSGKTCIAMQLEEQLKRRLGTGGAVYRCNYETPRAVHLTADYMIGRFDAQYDPDISHYLLLDEITHVADWEKAANYALRFPNIKLVFFSSNRSLLSSEFDAYREGGCEVIDVLPLSMEEYALFRGIREVTPQGTPYARRRYALPTGEETTLAELYRKYLDGRALPGLERDFGDENGTDPVSDGACSAILLHDILEVGSYEGVSAITDPALLRSIISIMAESMGRNVSATWVGKQIPRFLSRPSTTKTVESYMRALLNAHLLYIAPRYDIRADRELKTLPKYYMADMRLFGNFMAGYPEQESLLLENCVFFELKRRGYTVYNGKLPQDEIKFMAQNGDERAYVQISVSFGEHERRQLLTPLRKIRDDCPKVIVCAESETRSTADGIMIINAAEFLMGASWSRKKAVF